MRCAALTGARARATAMTMAEFPKLIAGLGEIAQDHDALICDVWGVLHNGADARPQAVEALRKFRQTRGPVVLLSNAPRPVSVLEEQFARFGVPNDCYDAIITSGVAAREGLAARMKEGARLALYHLGPERDRGVFEGLAIDCVEPDQARVVLCTGLFDDETEGPDDYADTLKTLHAHGLELLCANPDHVVQRGGKLIYCAGAIAAAYEKIGGKVIYYGKPHRPVYDMSLARAAALAGHDIVRPLAIGDGLGTDIRGANRAGLDSLFIADGIHGEDVTEMSVPVLRALFGKAGVTAQAAMRALVW